MNTPNRSAKVEAIRAWAAAEHERREAMRAWVTAERERRGLPPAPVSVEELDLFRAISEAGDEGIRLTELRGRLSALCGRERKEEAVAAVRRAAWVAESVELRANARGHVQRQVVLRMIEKSV